jgi:hypothetical protein
VTAVDNGTYGPVAPISVAFDPVRAQSFTGAGAVASERRLVKAAYPP